MMGRETAWNMYSIDSNKEYGITLHFVGIRERKNEPMKVLVLSFVLEIQLFIITFTRYIFQSVKSLVIRFCESYLNQFYNRLHHIMTMYEL
jgi:transcriptional antiterminator